METSFDPKFWPSVGKLAPADSHRIVLAIGTYQKNPDTPGLNLEKLQGSAGWKRMIFLHPEQRTLVERSFRGPARVRGCAGTGKTVVALHRTAVLAKRFIADPLREAGRPLVLFTTFIRSLPPVLANLYRRLPTAEPGAVEFLNVDKLAHRICSRHDQRPVLRPDAATNTFQEAFDAVVQRNTPLDQARVTRNYLREEVDAVLEGRGVDSLEEYLSLERTGRRTPFTAPMREQVRDLRTDWNRRLREAGIVDFPDVVRRARDLALRHHEPMYRAAVKESDGGRLFGGSGWHADVAFRRPAGHVSVLHAKVIPKEE